MSDLGVRTAARKEAEQRWRRDAGKPWRRVFEDGAVWAAGRLPTRDEIAAALDREGAQVGDCGHEPGEAQECGNGCLRLLLGYADAILALIQSRMTT